MEQDCSRRDSWVGNGFITVEEGVTGKLGEHLEQLDESGLYLWKSSIDGAGLGLYTNRFINKDEHVCEYRGSRIDKTEYHTR